MAAVGAPIGNKNSAKGRDWQDALRKAMIQYEDKDVPQGQALFKIATKVVQQALAGDSTAWQEIGNRLDGKPAQSLTVAGDDDRPLVTAIKMMIVHHIDGVDANSLIQKEKVVESVAEEETDPPLPLPVILGDGGRDE